MARSSYLYYVWTPARVLLGCWTVKYEAERFIAGLPHAAGAWLDTQRHGEFDLERSRENAMLHELRNAPAALDASRAS